MSAQASHASRFMGDRSGTALVDLNPSSAAPPVRRSCFAAAIKRLRLLPLRRRQRGAISCPQRSHSGAKCTLIAEPKLIVSAPSATSPYRSGGPPGEVSHHFIIHTPMEGSGCKRKRKPRIESPIRRGCSLPKTNRAKPRPAGLLN